MKSILKYFGLFIVAIIVIAMIFSIIYLALPLIILYWISTFFRRKKKKDEKEESTFNLKNLISIAMKAKGKNDDAGGVVIDIKNEKKGVFGREFNPLEKEFLNEDGTLKKSII